MFFWNLLAFLMIQWMLAIWSLLPPPFLIPAWISGSSHTIEAWCGEFEHYFASVWDECNCAVVSAFFGIAFLWDWNENWPFPVLWPRLSFPNLLACWVPYWLLLIIFLLVYSNIEGEEWVSKNFLLRKTNFPNQLFFWPDLKKLCTVNLDSDFF